MKKSQSLAQAVVPLSGLRERIDAWRAQKTRVAERMPLPLWDEAFACARAHGAFAVSRALGISYARLHAHVLESSGGQSATPDFVEVRVPQLISTTSKLIIEVDDLQGDRMRIEAEGSSVGELALLVSTFLERKR